MYSRTLAFIAVLTLALAFVPNAALAQYQLTNLVSNQVGQARHIDPQSVNAWGLAYGPGGPFWVNDAGSGWSTLYNGTGEKKSLQVEIPSTNGGIGSPTGIVFNGSPDFQVQGHASIFIFASLDGTISGWAPQSDFNNAIVAVPGAGAVYTGLAVTSRAQGNFLFAADVANNKVDMYDSTFKLVKSFTDTTLPGGFAPFGIQDIAGLLYVTFADSTFAPGGFVDVFNEDGTFLRQLVKGEPLNQPWGVALAPSDFGPLSNALLVSNNTDLGTINAFNARTGQFIGTVKNSAGKAIHIDQLWGIEFGGGTLNNGRTNELFFTAGPHNNLAGTFGSINFKQ